MSARKKTVGGDAEKKTSAMAAEGPLAKNFSEESAAAPQKAGLSSEQFAREKAALWAALETGSGVHLKAALETPGGRDAAMERQDDPHSEWSGMTPLRAALEMRGADPILAELLWPLSDLSAAAFPVRSSLAWAVMKNMSSPMFEACLAACDPLAVDASGATPLELALSWSGVERVKRLVPVSNPGCRCRGGNTLLMIAASRRDEVEIIEILLKTNDPTAKNHYGETALMLAAAEGCPATLRPLLAVSDPDARDNSGCTALMHFASADTNAVIMSHASWAFAGKNNSAAAEGQAKASYVEEMGALLLSVSDPAAVNKKGHTAFQMAVSNGNFEIAELLAPCANEREMEWAQRHFKNRPDFETAMPRAAAQKEALELRREVQADTTNGEKPIAQENEAENPHSGAERIAVRKL